MGVVVGGVSGCDGVGAAGGGVVHDVREVGDGVVARFELRLVLDLLAIELLEAVDRARAAHAASVDGDDGMFVEHVGAGACQPDRQLQRRRQVRAGGEHQGAGIVRSLLRFGAHHADAQRSGSPVHRVEVGVVARAIQLDAGGRRGAGIAEFLRCAVVPRQFVLRLGYRRWPAGCRRLGCLALRPGAGVGGEARVGGQAGCTAGQQCGHHDQRRGECGAPAHADHSSDWLIDQGLWPDSLAGRFPACIVVRRRRARSACTGSRRRRRGCARTAWRSALAPSRWRCARRYRRRGSARSSGTARRAGRARRTN